MMTCVAVSQVQRYRRVSATGESVQVEGFTFSELARQQLRERSLCGA